MRLMRIAFALPALTALGLTAGGCSYTERVVAGAAVAGVAAGATSAIITQARYEEDYYGPHHGLRPGDPCPDKPGTVVPNGRGGLTCDCIPRPTYYRSGMLYSGSAYGYHASMYLPPPPPRYVYMPPPMPIPRGYGWHR